jgi:hypothetical protein
VGVECFQTICAGKRGLPDKLIDKREEINLISSLCLANFWIYQLAWCSHVLHLAVKSLEINSYKMRLGFN